MFSNIIHFCEVMFNGVNTKFDPDPGTLHKEVCPLLEKTVITTGNIKVGDIYLKLTLFSFIVSGLTKVYSV